MCEAAGVEYAKSEDPDAPDWLIWMYHYDDAPSWLPDWVNGVPPEELYEWMLEQSATVLAIREAMLAAGMRPRACRMSKPDCLENCIHHYIAYYAKTFGANVPVAGCHVDSNCTVGQDVCDKYERGPEPIPG